MSNLLDALADLKAEVLKGGDLALASDIAADYQVNPALLLRKFAESFGTVEAVRATAAATSTRNLGERLAATVAGMCARYGVAPERCIQGTFNGVRYTIVCSVSGRRSRPYVAVSHDDSRVWNLPTFSQVR